MVCRAWPDSDYGEIQQAFGAVRVWLFFPYAGLFVIATIFGSLAQYITTEERTARVSIVPILVMVLFVAAVIAASRNRASQLDFSMGFIRRAMMRQDYTKAVRYADEMIRRNPTEEARLQAALTCVLANDLNKAEQYVRASLQTLTTQPASTQRRSRLRHQQLSFAQSILGIIHIAQRDYDTAESLLLQALQDDPCNALALINYAEILLLQGGAGRKPLRL